MNAHPNDVIARSDIDPERTKLSQHPGYGRVRKVKPAQVAPYDRTSVRRTHQRITQLAQRGKYREAEYALMGASAEYRAVFAMLRLVVRLRYMTTEKHPVPA